MDKTGDLTDESPCAACGSPSCGKRNGIPYCAGHIDTPSEQMPTVIEKAGELLKGE